MYQVKHIYGESNKVSRLQDVATARLRLGYKYICHYSLYGDVNGIPCKVCRPRQGHTVEHFIY